MKRELVVPRAAQNVAWFSFDELCNRPLAAADYLAIAERYAAVILEGIPRLDPGRRNEAQRLHILIDALYEARTLFIASAEVPPERDLRRRRRRLGIPAHRLAPARDAERGLHRQSGGRRLLSGSAAQGGWPAQALPRRRSRRFPRSPAYARRLAPSISMLISSSEVSPALPRLTRIMSSRIST